MTKQHSPRLAAVTLPTEAGHYWYRANSTSSWVIWEVYTDSKKERLFLHNGYTHRAMAEWSLEFPIGEWVKIPRPEEKP